MSTLTRLAALPLIAVLAAGCGGTRGNAASDLSTLTADDLKNRTEPIEILLQRKLPGLVVSRNEAGDLVLQVRGSTDYFGRDTPPLFVLDGLPFSPGPGGALTGINPEDIATIKVLRGPDAVIYGIDGANGVIVITTKRATRKL